MISKARKDKLWTAYNEAVSRYSKLPHVFAVDIGLKYKNRIRTAQPTIRFHVPSKKNKKDLLKSELLPASIKGVLTDVLEANYQKTWQPGYYKLDPARLRKFKVIQPGISIGDDYSSCGTLGLIVRDKDTPGKLFALTAAHVIDGETGEEIYQPAGTDSQSLNNPSFGRILRRDFSQDVGLIQLKTGVKFIQNQYESNVIVAQAAPLSEFTNLSLINARVFKSGRTTGLTEGIIDGIGRYGDLKYGVSIAPVDMNNPNNIEISYGGDSGAVWYDTRNYGIGVQVIGENDPHPSKERAIAVALPAVMHILNIDFL
jgi:hypothetical protein